jgi:hypothetical protein
MGRLAARGRPERERVLVPVRRMCPACGAGMRIRYENRRTLATLSGVVRLRLKIRRCEGVGCARHHRSYRTRRSPKSICSCRPGGVSKRTVALTAASS